MGDSGFVLTNFEYLTKLGQPLDSNNYPKFDFQSIRLLKKQKTPTYKDDIISIFYVIMYLLCDRKHIENGDLLLNEEQMLEYRQLYSIVDLPK